MKKWLFLWAAVLLFAAAPVQIQAKSSSYVKYDPAQKEYGFFQKSGKKVTKPGLYRIQGKKAGGRSFDGIYYVSSKGQIVVTPGIRYLAQSKTIGRQKYSRGYYYFGKDGKLSDQSGVFYRKNSKIHGYAFRGYYYYTDTGRIPAQSLGLVYLNCKVRGREFKGYYYRDAMSRLYTRRGIRKITLKTGANQEFPGYRYLGKGGRLDLKPGIHKLNLTYKGVKYQGYYCFTEKNGRMCRKKGLVSIGDVYYYVADNTGKCLTNAKKKVKGFSYAFGADGAGRRTSTKLGGLTSQLNAQIGSYPGIWSVYVKRLDDNDSLTINDISMSAASLIKAYTMASLYEQIQQGNVRETPEIRVLLAAMITISSNEAYDELVARQTASHSFPAGCSVINQYLQRNAYRNTEIHSGYSGFYISDGSGRSNNTSVKDCGNLLESIYRGTCVDPESSQKMLSLLKGQQRRWKIPAGVPSGITVANKTGETTYSSHDIAIVYGPKCTYILCVMSLNCYNADSHIAQISRTVYNYLN